MKKVTSLIVSALAASAIFADAQLYEMDITVKTTKSMSGTMADVACDCKVDASSSGLYRKPSNTVKIKGVIWGCDCGTLFKGIPFTTTTNPYGYFFWNVTTRKPLNVRLSWEFVNRIDKTSKKAEAVWILYSEDGMFYLTGAGFGTIKDTTSSSPCYLITSYFPTMNGSCAGWMNPDAVVTTKATASFCSWCDKIEGTPEVIATAKGMSICQDSVDPATGKPVCSANESNSASAAFGTWKVKYNAKVSKNMSSRQGGSESLKITDFYNFPAYVLSAMEKGDREYVPPATTEPTPDAEPTPAATNSVAAVVTAE